MSPQGKVELIMRRPSSAVFAVGVLTILTTLVLLSKAQGQERPGLSKAQQAVRGHLIDLDTGDPVPAGDVTVILGADRLATTDTDENGFFFLPLERPGVYRLEARRLGYASTLSQDFRVIRGDTVSVRFGLHVSAIAMDPLVVVARTNRGQNKFRDHQEEWGQGIFITPEMMDSIAPLHYADVFRKQEDVWLSWGWGQLSTGSRGPVPRVRTFKGRGCLAYMVNGIQVRDHNWYLLDGMDPGRIRAVEIFRYPGEVPPDLRSFGGITSETTRAGAFGNATYSVQDFYECGVVVYWTDRGW